MFTVTGEWLWHYIGQFLFNFFHLEQQRMAYEKQCEDDYLDRKGRKSQASSRASSRVSYINERDSERNREAVLNYIRRKEGRKHGDSRSSSSLSVPSTPDTNRPTSVQSSRSLPTPVMSRKTIEEVSSISPLNFILHNIFLIFSKRKFGKPFKFQKSFLLRCIHHFKSDLINNMDHMRISGTEPSSVIISQTK